MNAPQLFRSCSPSHHTWVTANGSRLPCRVRNIALVLRHPHECLRIQYRCASAQVLIEPRSPTTARQCREIFRTTVRLPKYAHVVRFAEEAALHSTGLPNQPPSQPDSDTIVVPALVSVFDSEVTSLECVTTRPLGYVLPSSSHTFPRKQNPWPRPTDSNAFSDFPIRNQKLKVLIPNGCLQFGTVSSKATAHNGSS